MSKTSFKGKILFLGFGSITLGTLPLIIEHIDTPRGNIQIISKDTLHKHVADEYGVKYIEAALTRENYLDVLVQQCNLSKGDFLINLSVDIATLDLVVLCHEIGALYIDTCIESWTGFYKDESLSYSMRSNYALREAVLEKKESFSGGPTAILAHGANPGLVNHLVKRALIEISQLKTSEEIKIPKSQAEWAKLACDLGVKVIQISERDTQRPIVPKQRNEFVNTWSVDGYIAETIHQPSEFGLGTHEKELVPGMLKHDFGCQAAFYLNKPAGLVRVRGWTPLEGHYHGFPVTHNESISIADYLTLKDDHQTPTYRPTVFYCYHPCDSCVLSTHEMLGREKEEQSVKRLLNAKDILDGCDELGVLLLGDFGLDFNAYWHGSQLNHKDAIKIPNNTATTLQVTSSVFAGVIWAIENPNAGIVEPEQMDFERILEITDPYTEKIVSMPTNWKPNGKTDYQISDFLAQF